MILAHTFSDKRVHDHGAPELDNEDRNVSNFYKRKVCVPLKAGQKAVCLCVCCMLSAVGMSLFVQI